MKTVLVVDDEYSVVEALSSLLADEGYTVVTAAHGGEALERLAHTPTPDLVLMDLMMPVLDGRATFAAIRANAAWNNIPVVAMSAAGQPEPSEGFAEFLRKPFGLDALLDVVLRLVGPAR